MSYKVPICFDVLICESMCVVHPPAIGYACQSWKQCTTWLLVGYGYGHVLCDITLRLLFFAVQRYWC